MNLRFFVRLVVSVVLTTFMASCGGGEGAAAAMYTIGGTVTGLPPGEGETLNLTSQTIQTGINVGNGPFTFPIRLPFDAPYAVQTGMYPGYTCTLVNGSGIVTGNVTTVSVNCSPIPVITFEVTLAGLAAGSKITLGIEGTTYSPLTANGTYSLHYSSVFGGIYNVGVQIQPVGLACTVSNGSGTISATVISNVSVTCSPITEYAYSTGGCGFAGSSPMVTLSPFGIGTNGVLTPLNAPPPAALASGTCPTLTSIATDPTGHYLYVTTGGDTLSQFSIGTAGALTPLSPPTIGTGGDSTSVTIDPSGRFAYVVNSADSTLSQYSLGSDGALTPLSTATIQTGRVPVGVIIDFQDRYAYVVNSADNTVSQYLLGAGGVLTPMSVPATSTGSAPVAIAADPTGQYVYAVNSGDNTVSQYNIGAGGTLSPLSSATVSTGNSPNSLAIDPTGRYVYVVNESDRTVSEYGIGTSGALTLVNTLVVAGDGALSSIAVDPTGRYAYVGDNADSAIFEYDIGAGGALAPLLAAPDSVPADNGGSFIAVIKAY